MTVKRRERNKMSETILILTKQMNTPSGTLEKGDEVIYTPWNFEWQGMTEQERVEKGIFVNCYGHGEFEVYKLGEDVSIMSKGERLKEAKKKLNDDAKEGTLQFMVKIKAFQDGGMDIEGPINDPILMMNIFASAMQTVVHHNLDKKKEPKKESNLVLN